MEWPVAFLSGSTKDRKEPAKQRVRWWRTFCPRGQQSLSKYFSCVLPPQLILQSHPGSCHQQNLNTSSTTWNQSSSDNLLSSQLTCSVASTSSRSLIHWPMFSPPRLFSPSSFNYPIYNSPLRHISNPFTLPPSFRLAWQIPVTPPVPVRTARHNSRQTRNTVNSWSIISHDLLHCLAVLNSVIVPSLTLSNDYWLSSLYSTFLPYSRLWVSWYHTTVVFPPIFLVTP